MQRDLLPNTYRDINELPPLSRSNGEPMEIEPGFHRSVIHPVDNEQIDESKRNEMTNRPLLKTSVRTNANDIEKLENTTNDENALAQATGFDSNFGTTIDADEVLARELQQKEYSQESLIRTRHPYERFRIPSDDEIRVVDSDHSLEPDVMPHFETDEEFAAYLQAQEDRKRERMHRRPFPFFPVPLTRPNHPMSSENDQRTHNRVFPMHYPFSRRSNNNDDDDDDNDGEDYRHFPINNPHALLELLGNPSFVFGHPRNYRRTGNLQDTEDDFGPEDYERLLQLDDTIKKKKLSRHQVNSIKEISFHSNANNTDEENKCSVCLENFEENQPLRQFPCQHVYHKHCADQWLRENNVCPICRKPPVNINTQSSSSSSNSSRRRHNDYNKNSNSNNNNNPRQPQPNYIRSSTNRQHSNNSSTMPTNSQSRRGHGHGHPPSSSYQRPS